MGQHEETPKAAGSPDGARAESCRVDAEASFADTITALNERFEPKSRQTRYQAEFQTRRKKKVEGWVEFADDLRTLAEKGFPNLSEEAREQLALQNYLQQLDQPQIAFSVKQKRPTTLDEAVTATIEMETYLPASSKVTVAMCEQEDEPAKPVPIAPISDTTAKLTSLIERLVERVEKLEQQGCSNRGNGTQPEIDCGPEQQAVPASSAGNGDILPETVGKAVHPHRETSYPQREGPSV